jgi:hypothetical protein
MSVEYHATSYSVRIPMASNEIRLLTYADTSLPTSVRKRPEISAGRGVSWVEPER